MPTLKRSLAMPIDEVGVYHVYNRCVQQAYLCGYDKVMEIDYSHRKVWIRENLRRLAGAFGIDIFKYSLMDNHLHLLLRNRPDLVAEWSDDEVVRRWWAICPERVELDGSPADPQPIELEHWLGNQKIMVDLRKRLANPSWLMQVWCSEIGRRANQETGKSGRFFEERYKSVRLLNEAAVLACALYIDLNPVRAGIVKTPEESQFTSVSDRIEGRRQRLARALASSLDVTQLTQEGGLPLDLLCGDAKDADAWLSRLTLDAEQRLAGYLSECFDDVETIQWEELEPDSETTSVIVSCSTEERVRVSDGVADTGSADNLLCIGEVVDGASRDEGDVSSDLEKGVSETISETATAVATTGKSEVIRSGVLRFPAPRASNKGFLSLTLDEYLELLDWTGRQLMPDKQGVIPEDAPPILERLGIKPKGWLELVDNLCRWFGVAVGKVEQLEQEAVRVGRNWLWRRKEMANAFT